MIIDNDNNKNNDNDNENSNNKQLLDEVFVLIRNNQGQGKCYQPKLKAEANNTYRDLDYSGYHKNRI